MLVEVVTVADVDAEKHVDDSLVQIWNLKFGHKATDDHPSLTLVVRLRIFKCCVFRYMIGHFSKKIVFARNPLQNVLISDLAIWDARSKNIHKTVWPNG